MHTNSQTLRLCVCVGFSQSSGYQCIGVARSPPLSQSVWSPGSHREQLWFQICSGARYLETSPHPLPLTRACFFFYLRALTATPRHTHR